ncbi:MAG: hypothetical protein IKM33_03065, partial [Clostridia bacterium]|nr:hypothetical protein [Clostridia bacterium]
SDEKIFRQSKQKAARIVDPIRRIFVTNDGKDSVDSLCEGFLEVPSNLLLVFPVVLTNLQKNGKMVLKDSASRGETDKIATSLTFPTYPKEIYL